MTMSTFLDAGYTSLTEEYMRMGSGLLLPALDEMLEWRQGGPPEDRPEKPAPTQPQAAPQSAAGITANTLAELEKAMKSTQFKGF